MPRRGSGGAARREHDLGRLDHDGDGVARREPELLTLRRVITETIRCSPTATSTSAITSPVTMLVTVPGSWFLALIATFCLLSVAGRALDGSWALLLA
jgi:hypothetical protein